MSTVVCLLALGIERAVGGTIKGNNAREILGHLHGYLDVGCMYALAPTVRARCEYRALSARFFGSCMDMGIPSRGRFLAPTTATFFCTLTLLLAEKTCYTAISTMVIKTIKNNNILHACGRWSAVSRTNRYRKRCAADGDASDYVDAENPLPGFIDPITLEPVVTPAISCHGHVMGLATWKVRLFWRNPTTL